MDDSPFPWSEPGGQQHLTPSIITDNVWSDRKSTPEIIIDYIFNLPHELVGVAEFARHVSVTIIIPGALYLSALVGLFVVTAKAYRIMFPPGAEETYQNAIRNLKRDVVFSQSSSRRGMREAWDRRSALDMLRKCTQRKPSLPGPFRTLATELLYDDESCHRGWDRLMDQWWPHSGNYKSPLDECIAVIKTGLIHHPKDDELDKLRLEAEAIKRWGRGGTAGKGVDMMMRVGRIGSDHLLSGCRMR
uniref:Uncharacterized protein n=1 Tax=Odontella aurita TaxID=265563 RepID=A0A7S4NBN4_9STRA|mmetsp:Transcript_56571/g.169196  ORF Transcript_56571/g.169196 Transcript_56571/m.169196 type:complete len:246 (+) Transcript_56571:107-844(+)